MTEKLLSYYKVKGFHIAVGLFRSHLLSRDDIYSLYRGRFYVWGPRLCSLYRGFRYIEVRYIEDLFHTFYRRFGRAEEYRSLYRGLRYRGSSNRGFTVADKTNLLHHL